VSGRRSWASLAQAAGFGGALGVACGASSALFLWLLQVATDFRVGHEGLIYALPVAGVAVGWLYERLGRPIQGGNNLVIDTLHDGGPPIPVRMAPLVLVGTVLTHLFGGSAGREGTAVQMGASLADALAHRIRVTPRLRLQLLASGVAGGFGAVFGTPMAGAVFGMEFVVLGRLELGAVVPALIAAVVGDVVTRALGIVHSHYPLVGYLAISPVLLAKWVAFSAVMAAATVLFVELTHWLKHLGERHFPRLPVRMFVGGATVVVAWKLLGTSDYLGLGIPTILRSFNDPHLAVGAFAAKLVLTAITVGAGFLGGEVTPLFFVGATLGNVTARALHLPLEMGAGVGMAAVFAAAANAPIALSIMAAELLGVHVLPHAAIVCVLTYVMTGHRGIYPAQRLPHTKFGARRLGGATTLRELRMSRRIAKEAKALARKRSSDPR